MVLVRCDFADVELILDDFGCGYGGSSGCGHAVAAIAAIKRYY